MILISGALNARVDVSAETMSFHLSFLVHQHNAIAAARAVAAAAAVTTSRKRRRGGG